MADAEHRLLVAPEDSLVRVGVAPRGVVQALTAGERLVAAPSVLPGAVVGERPSLELADPDVVQVAVDDARHGRRSRLAECDPCGFLGAREPRDDAEVDLHCRHLLAQGSCLLAALRRETPVSRRIAVDDPVHVEQ